LPSPGSLDFSRQRKAEAAAETRDAIKVHIQFILSTKLGRLGAIWPKFAKLSKIILETCRRNYLDDLTLGIACVPEGVPLATGLEHPVPCFGQYYLISEQGTQRALKNEGILIFPVVAVERSCECSRSYRVVNHRK
jgi:hypothetical protein